MIRRLVLLLAIAGMLLMCIPAFGHDFPAWKMFDPATQSWFEALMQPDNPAVSCCGEADHYWCDDIGAEQKWDEKRGEMRTVNFCLITDDRPDAPFKRKHIPVGTRIDIPAHKFKFGDGDPQKQIVRNPTGHSVVFLSRGDYVYCFVLGMMT
jgi:hypothetical protein